MPDISIVIPTFNRAELLRNAVDSVLAQTGVDFEVVISDNCSTDHTAAVAAAYAADPRVRYFCNARNLGMVGNWKHAIYELALADWFVLMSDDDHFVDPDYLHEVVTAIQSYNPKFVYAGGYVRDLGLGQSTELRLPFEGLVAGANIFAARGTQWPQDAILCNMAFRRDDAARLGFLSNPQNLSCDSELYLMLCSEGNVFVVPRPVCVYLKHGANLVDKIMTSRRLLDSNIDHLLNPYVHARRRGMSASAIEAFRSNTRLDACISATLLRLLLHSSDWYAACRARVQAVAPDVLADVESNWRYKLKLVVIAAAGPLLRRRYPLVDHGETAI